MIRDNSGSDDMHNVLTMNFAYAPRVFTTMLALKIFRIRRIKQTQRKLIKKLGIGVDKANII